jgi:glycosyltransferase involved in cell wall biosynthesis
MEALGWIGKIGHPLDRRRRAAPVAARGGPAVEDGPVSRSAGEGRALPLVTAVIPTYNRADTVARAIDSVLGQTYPRIETIVVDDGSTDGTAAVLAGYGDRIRVVSQPNAGASAARNAGIRAASGEIVTFLDSDDRWLPAKTERQVDLLARAGPSVVCCICDTTMRYAGGRELRAFEQSALAPGRAEAIWTNVLPVLATRFLLFNQAAAIRRPALLACGGFDEALWVMEDYDLALKLAAQGPWAVIADPLVVWHGGAENSLSEAAYRDPVRLHSAIERILTRCLHAAGSRDAAARFFLKRRRAIARREIRSAWLRSQPGRLRPALGALVSRADALGQRLLRRLPGYPRMRVEPVQARVGGPSQACAPP